MILIAPFAFVGGMLAGSFASVIAHRVPQGEAWATGRSRVPDCGHQIAAYDNVPVFSWLLCAGAAAAAASRSRARYPLAELAIGRRSSR